MNQTPKVQKPADFSNAYLEVDHCEIDRKEEVIRCEAYNPNNLALDAVEKVITFAELAAGLFANLRGMVEVTYSDDSEGDEYFLDHFEGMSGPDQWEICAHLINKREGRRSPLEIKESHIGVQSNPFTLINMPALASAICIPHRKSA